MPRVWTAAVALLSAAALFVSLTRTGTAQPPAGTPAVPGRYQMHVVANNSVSTVFVVDTQTGQTWYRQTLSTSTGWSDMGSAKTHPEKR